jgi:hypothetical protein
VAQREAVDVSDGERVSQRVLHGLAGAAMPARVLVGQVEVLQLTTAHAGDQVPAHIKKKP